MIQVKMEKKAEDLSERLVDYGAEIVKLTAMLSKTFAGRQLAAQLLRSGTSAGANYEEACGAESRADFTHKLHIVFKEIKESLYWLRIVKKAEILKTSRLDEIIDETRQLTNIVAKSIITAKKKK